MVCQSFARRRQLGQTAQANAPKLWCIAQYRANTPHTRAHRRLLHNAEIAQLGGMGNMRAAANFLAEIANTLDGDTFAVALAEQPDRARRACRIYIHFGADHRQGARNLHVHQRLDGL